MNSYRAFDASFPTQKEKARAAGPGLEKEREEEEGIQLWGSAETSPVCFRLPVIDS